MPTFAFSNFVRRQTPESEFSHCTLTDENVIGLVERNFAGAKQGYREGVMLVPVPPDGFFSGMVQLKEGDRLIGIYKSRRAGETPRKSTFRAGAANKLPAKSVYIVLYRADVLAEDGDRSTSADWEIVSINASPTEEEAPIPPNTLIANHLKLDGGTATNMTDEEFVKMLRQSVAFWSDKALIAPKDLC